MTKKKKGLADPKYARKNIESARPNGPSYPDIRSEIPIQDLIKHFLYRRAISDYGNEGRVVAVTNKYKVLKFRESIGETIGRSIR